jgi:hypothetical protein
LSLSGKEKEQKQGGKEKDKTHPTAMFNGCRRVPLRDDPPRNNQPLLHFPIFLLEEKFKKLFLSLSLSFC